MKKEDTEKNQGSEPDDINQWVKQQQSEGLLNFAPFNNFFQDQFFVLLYFYDGGMPKKQQLIKEQLKVIANESATEHQRAEAALTLAHQVISRADNRAALIQEDRERANQWFELAIDFGSVLAAADLAQLHLASNQLMFHFLSEQMVLPTLVNLKTGEREVKKTANWKAYHAWYRGARATLRHLDHNFDDWDMQTFDAAFNCILGFLTLVPERRWNQLTPAVENMKTALSWVEPLWRDLVRLSPSFDLDSDADRSYRQEQLQASLLAMKAEGVPSGLQASKRDKPVSSGSPLQVRVIAAEIPCSSDRAENDYLKQFEPLRDLIELTQMPDELQIQGIESALRSEFPWAHEVIRQIIGELYARHRHGVLILGMSPIGLVGLPGSGKTRFCHRLSALLGTPNTVINMAGMGDAKLLKGFTRGWAGSRPSRILEFIQQSRVANPLFILDEVDKAGCASLNGGDPQEPLLDLLEPGNARRYQDLYLLAECDVSHCLYIATANSLSPIREPVRSRLRLIHFPSPSPDHTDTIIRGMLADIERSWRLPAGTLELSTQERARLQGVAPRQMHHAVIDMLGSTDSRLAFTRQ